MSIRLFLSLVLGMLGSPLGQLRNKPMGFPSTEAMGGADFLDKFPGMARMNPRLDSRSYLDSRSSSPVDSETSGFSSSSDHLSDLLVGLYSASCFASWLLCYRKVVSALPFSLWGFVFEKRDVCLWGWELAEALADTCVVCWQSSLRISPPLNFVMSNMQKDHLKLALGQRLDQDNSPLTPPPSATPANALAKRWPGASVWPSMDLMDAADETFSIEREARLHRQAAGVCIFGSCLAFLKG